jgi:hypothetical protein
MHWGDPVTTGGVTGRPSRRPIFRRRAGHALLPRPFGTHLTGNRRQRDLEKKMPKESAKLLRLSGSGRQIPFTAGMAGRIIAAVSAPFPAGVSGSGLGQIFIGAK